MPHPLLGHGLPREYMIKLRSEPPVEPASAAAATDALRTLLRGRPGAPRWAATGWATSLVGPWRDVARPDDDGTDGLDALAELVDRLQPSPAVERWPGWARGSRDPGVLALGVAQGRPGLRRLVDIPDHVAAAVVTADVEQGWARLTHPQPQPGRTPVLQWDPRLGALVELIRHCGGPSGVDHTAVGVLAGWTVGPGRAHCGAWAARRGLPEAHTAAARRVGRLRTLDVAAAVGEVLGAAAAAA